MLALVGGALYALTTYGAFMDGYEKGILIVAVPVMVIMMLMTQRRDIMGQFVLPPVLRGLGWLATLVMGLTVVALAWSSFA